MLIGIYQESRLIHTLFRVVMVWYDPSEANTFRHTSLALRQSNEWLNANEAALIIWLRQSHEASNVIQPQYYSARNKSFIISSDALSNI